jgi:hypothetical protein
MLCAFCHVVSSYIISVLSTKCIAAFVMSAKMLDCLEKYLTDLVKVNLVPQKYCSGVWL